MPRPVQDAHRHVGHRQSLDLGDCADVVGDRRGDVQHVGGVGPDGDLVHVEHRRRVEHRAAVGHRQNRDGVGHALAHQRGAVDRVDGEVAFRAVAVADVFAVVEHRRVVLLAFADHHDAAHRHRVHQLAYRVDGRAVAALLVAAADPAAGGHGAGLGDPHQLQGQVAIRGFTARPWLAVRDDEPGSGEEVAAPTVMVADCPRSGSPVGSWDTRAVTSQPEPTAKTGQTAAAAGRPRHVLVARAAGGRVHRAGRRGRDVFVSAGPEPRGTVPSYDAAAALRADAPTLGFPIRLPQLPAGWQANSGGRGGIENGRTDPSTGQPLNAVTSTVGYISPSGMYLSLTQSNADEDKLVGSIHPSPVSDRCGRRRRHQLGGLSGRRTDVEPVWTTG